MFTTRFWRQIFISCEGGDKGEKLLHGFSCSIKYRFFPHTVMEGYRTADIIMTDILGIQFGQLWRLRVHGVRHCAAARPAHSG